MRGFLDQYAGGVLQSLGQGAAAGCANEIGVDDCRRVGCVAGAAAPAGGRNHERVEQGLGECRDGGKEDEWSEG